MTSESEQYNSFILGIIYRRSRLCFLAFLIGTALTLLIIGTILLILLKNPAKQTKSGAMNINFFMT